MDAILDDRRVDPFKIWLDALPPWDGEKPGSTSGSATSSRWAKSTRTS